MNAAGGASQQGQNEEDGAEGDNSESGTGGGSRTTQDRVEQRQARDRERQCMPPVTAALAALKPSTSAASALAAATRTASTVSLKLNDKLVSDFLLSLLQKQLDSI